MPLKVCETSHADHGNSDPRSVLRAEIAGLSHWLTVVLWDPVIICVTFGLPALPVWASVTSLSVKPHLGTEQFLWHLLGFRIRQAAWLYGKLEFPLFLFADTSVREAKGFLCAALDSGFSGFLPLLPRTYILALAWVFCLLGLGSGWNTDLAEILCYTSLSSIYMLKSKKFWSCSWLLPERSKTNKHPDLLLGAGMESGARGRHTGSNPGSLHWE